MSSALDFSCRRFSSRYALIGSVTMPVRQLPMSMVVAKEADVGPLTGSQRTGSIVKGFVWYLQAGQQISDDVNGDEATS